MIHLSMLRNHARWAVFLRNLRYIVVDECHYYRGIFGSNVAMVLRRLLRLCTRYSAAPTVIFASATTASPAATASELIGQTVAEVTEDGSPQGARTVALWEPALRDRHRRRKRRAGAAFRRRRGRTGDGRPDRRGRADADVRPVAARRRTDRAGRAGTAGRHRSRARRAGGVLPGRLSGRGPPRTGTRAGRGRVCAAWPPPTRWNWASTSPGWTPWCWPAFPGTVTSFWQQAGRSGRRGQGALIVLIARDDPLDTYLVHHPAALLDKPIERVVIDPGQPVCPWTPTALRGNRTAVDRRGGAGVERRGGGGDTRRRRAAAAPAERLLPQPRASIRIRRWTSAARRAARSRSWRPIPGGCSAARASARRRRRFIPGAVYLHQGESYVVDSLDFEDGVAFVHAEDPGYTTFARELTDIAVTGHGERTAVRPGHGRPGSGVRDQHRDRLSAAPAGRRGDRLRRTRHADPHTGHHGGDVHDHA